MRVYCRTRACSSVVEHLPFKQLVVGSIPTRPSKWRHMRGIAVNKPIAAKCRSLRLAGRSLGEICRTVGLSKSTVFSYIKEVPLSAEQRELFRSRSREGTRRSNRLRRGISRPHNRLIVRPRLSAKLILCASHFWFDGSLKQSQAAYYNRSETLVAQQEQLVSQLFQRGGRRRLLKGGVIEFTIDSVEFVAFIERVTQKIHAKASFFPRRWKRMILQAFFDDEGNVYMSKEGRDRRVRGYQYDDSILQLIQQLLADFHIHARISRSSRCVEIKGQSELITFRKEIGFRAGIALNPARKNSIWKQPIEKRLLLDRAIASFR